MLSFTYSIVLSSTGKIPFFAPASIAMFAIVNLLSMDRFVSPSPLNSIAMYLAPSTPISPIILRIISLPLTHCLKLPFSTNLSDSGTLNHDFPVAIVQAKSVLPTPVENAPRAP